MRPYIKSRMALVILLLLLLISIPSISGSADTPRIGYVDLQQVISLSQPGQAARAKMQVERDEKQKEVNAREEEIKRLEGELEKRAPVLSEEAKREREETIGRKIRDLRRTIEDFNRDLAKRENELVAELLKEVTVVIMEYGKEKRYTLILEKGQAGVLYGDEGADITQEIINVYNAKKPGAKKPGAKKP